MIMRIWRGITPREQADAFLEHLQHTALHTLTAQPGQRGAWVLRRIQGDHCEFQLLSLWESLDAVRAFAGDQPERAVYFAEDDKFLLDMEPLVRLYEVADWVGRVGKRVRKNRKMKNECCVVSGSRLRVGAE